MDWLFALPYMAQEAGEIGPGDALLGDASGSQHRSRPDDRRDAQQYHL